MSEKTWVESLPYPKGLMKSLYKTPILLYRLGLGFLVDRLFMIMTAYLCHLRSQRSAHTPGCAS